MSSFFLAKAGLKVALFEKEKLPRYKTCGGGLIHKSINMLPFSLNGIVEKEFFEVAVCDHKIKRSFVVKRDVPIISTVMRENFDYNIIKTAEKQGVEIFSNTKVVDIIDKTSEVLVITDSASYTAKYLIGADGANGITAKTISENRNYRRIPALECEIYLNDILLDKFSRFARFDFGIIHFGYGWVFPKNDHLSVGVLSMETKVNLNKQLQKYFAEIGIPDTAKIEKHGYSIPLNTNNLPLVKNRLLLTGDAAGLADPLMGEGISRALLSGKIAGEAISNNFDDPLEVVAFYNSRIYHEIIRDNKYTGFISRIVYNYPQLRSLLLKIKGQQLSDLVTEASMGEFKLSSEMRNPLNYLKLLINK
ncbi:putative oxidoreductase/MT0587 [bacterium BMS3Abin04]|nr:putative oxidoreductase/MT0587 [bacterium BMS3Abin04]